MRRNENDYKKSGSVEKIKNKPLISVVMPVYNAKKYVGKAIESILNQTFNKFELIIVNDFSTDETMDVITSFSKKDSRIKIINNNTRLDIGNSLNRGIAFASSNIIARMDADDISIPDRLELQFKLINSSRNIAVVGANIIIMDTAENYIATRTYPKSSDELKACLFKYSPFAHPVVMFKKDMFNEAGGYDPKYSPTEDLDLWFRLGVKYRFASVSKNLLKYRLYEKSSSHKVIKSLELLVFKIRINAIFRYGYRPAIGDIAYNLLQFITLWFTPAKLRIKMYNVLRNNNFI